MSSVKPLIPSQRSRLGMLSASCLALIVVGPTPDAFAQAAGEASEALPTIVVRLNQKRARRVTRAVRPPEAPQAAQPVVNSQDARSGTDGYYTGATSTAMKTDTPLLNTPKSVTVLTKEFIRDQGFTSIGEATRYVPGVIFHQGESNRDDVVIRGQRTNADFFVNGVRDDVQYYRDFYNVQRLEFLKGPDAMIFGRGGGGGIINRVTKEADGTRIREVTFGGNSYPGGRGLVDFGQAVSPDFALRFNGFYENTDSYRDYVNIQRYAVNPTFTWTPSDSTRVKVSYEHAHDRRVTDRGIPSQQRAGGALPQFPYPTDPSTFFGNPNLNYALSNVNIGTVVVEHDFDNGLKVKNTALIANYDKFYQNIYPGGPVNVAGTAVALTAYNNETDRRNLFNQTDFTYKFSTGWVNHTMLFGGEVGRQTGLSFRQDGFFNGTASTLTVNPLNPVTFVPVTFRNLPTGANNTYGLDLAGAYIQDQIDITRYLQLIGGVRFDRFDLESRDRRTGVVQARTDNLVSPRAGIVVKPIENLSIYGTYSVSYLPSAGDQFGSLNPGLILADPEKFENKEIGLKWQINPRLRFETAVYDLDRTNQRLADPLNPGFFILSGATKTRGYEASLTGYVTNDWQVTGGYAYTDARIVGATSATIVPGNRVGLVPYNTFSLFNRYQFTPMWAAGVGVIHFTDFYASSDDTVKLPGFTRVDAAVYFRLNEMWRGQLNVENIFNTRYIATADGNNNITPGSPRVLKLSATANF